MIKPGGNIDSWCGKCKLVLAHTIEAVVEDKPARVHCNTCQAQHTYKPNAPRKTTRKTSDGTATGPVTPRPAKLRMTRYQVLLKGKAAEVPRRYSVKEYYTPGEVLEHPTFGVGIATILKDGTKIEVLFENGPKVLVQGR